MDDRKTLYRLDENISFRTCSLFEGEDTVHGDCTNFYPVEKHWTQYYYCKQDGIHYHCTKHPEIELEESRECGEIKLICPRCGNEIGIKDENELRNKCLRMLNRPVFKNARLIRLDDWYVPEIKSKTKTESGYWMTTDIKTDRDGDTMIVLYIGRQGSEGKAQYFIKPEKLQLTSDHKDLDPATILSRIQVTLRDRELIQEYNEGEE